MGRPSSHPRPGQLDLTFRPAGRGGARPGAGRPRLPVGHRRQPDHRRRPELSRHHPVHVTLRAHRDIGRLRRSAAYAAIREATAVVVGRTDFRIVHLSIQHNHVHLIVEADDKRALASGLRAFTISATRRLNAAVGRRGAGFERYHLTILRTPRQVRHALAYVLGNWRRHREHLGGAVQARTPVDPYSSGPSFTGWRRLPPDLGLPRTYKPLLVCGARTWLLARGWREHHPLLDPHEVPGPGA